MRLRPDCGPNSLMPFRLRCRTRWRRSCADCVAARRRTRRQREAIMGQAQPKRRAVLIVEDDAELRGLTAALLEEEQVETIECESAEAALATLLIGGREIAMIFADVRLRGVMDG